MDGFWKFICSSETKLRARLLSLQITLFSFGKCEIRKIVSTLNVSHGWFTLQLNWNMVFLSIENAEVWLAFTKLILNLQCQKGKQEVTRGLKLCYSFLGPLTVLSPYKGLITWSLGFFNLLGKYPISISSLLYIHL